jgi:hypothetical protein
MASLAGQSGSGLRQREDSNRTHRRYGFTPSRRNGICKTERSFTMGDKGGKKDKNKSQKQKLMKHEQKEKHKHDKQPKSLLMRSGV